MSTAFGVQQTSAGVGTTASDMRHILASQWECTGVVDGLAVTGTTAPAYKVASGVAVCSKGPSDGKTLAWFPGGTTPTVSSSSASSPRIDAIWVTAHDVSQGDADNLVTIGVTQGTPSATPAVPQIPSYATLIATMTMPAGATTTANATSAGTVSYAVTYGSSLGVLRDYQNTWDGVADSSANWYTEDSSTVHLPTDRLLELRYSRCMSSVSASDLGSILIEFFVDGVPVVQSEILASASWETHIFSYNVEVPSGNHTIAVKNKHQAGGKIYYHYSAGSSRGTSHSTGMRFQVVDRGVVS